MRFGLVALLVHSKNQRRVPNNFLGCHNVFFSPVQPVASCSAVPETSRISSGGTRRSRPLGGSHRPWVGDLAVRSQKTCSTCKSFGIFLWKNLSKIKTCSCPFFFFVEKMATRLQLWATLQCHRSTRAEPNTKERIFKFAKTVTYYLIDWWCR